MFVQDEHEEYVAQMWRRVALCSVDVQDQLECYQQAIEALEVWTTGHDRALLYLLLITIISL